MRHFRTGILTLAFALCAGTVSFAACPGHGQGACFVDEDGDGICDRREAWHQEAGVCCDGTGDGSCGPGFTDEDGDGICDYYTAGGHWQGGTGHGRGCRGGRRR